MARLAFGGAWVDLECALFSAEETAAQVDGRVERLGSPAPQVILDAPGGEGRVARELASRGFDANWVDASPELAARARRSPDGDRVRRVAIDPRALWLAAWAPGEDSIAPRRAGTRVRWRSCRSRPDVGGARRRRSRRTGESRSPLPRAGRAPVGSARARRAAHRRRRGGDARRGPPDGLPARHRAARAAVGRGPPRDEPAQPAAGRLK